MKNNTTTRKGKDNMGKPTTKKYAVWESIHPEKSYPFFTAYIPTGMVVSIMPEDFHEFMSRDQTQSLDSSHPEGWYVIQIRGHKEYVFNDDYASIVFYHGEKVNFISHVFQERIDRYVTALKNSRMLNEGTVIEYHTSDNLRKLQMPVVS